MTAAFLRQFNGYKDAFLAYASNHSSHVLFALLVLWATVIRFRYLGVQPLWFDEAWVANTVGADSVKDMLIPPGKVQVAPSGFLLLSRVWLSLVGFSEWKIRLIPAFMSMGVLLLGFLYLCRKFSFFAGLIFVIIFGFSQSSLQYAYEYKHYSTDALAVILLLLSFDGMTSGSSLSKKKTAIASAVAIFCLLLSNVGVFLLPSIALYAGFAYVRSKSTNALRHSIAYLMAASAFFLLHYLTIIHVSANNSWLHEYWAKGFVLSDASYIEFLPVFFGILSEFFEYMFASYWLGEGRLAFANLMLITWIGSLIHAAYRKRIDVWLLFFVPVVTTAIVSKLNMYPFSPSRTSFFLYPLILMTIAYGLHSLCHYGKVHAHLLRFFTMVILLALFPFAGFRHSYFVRLSDDGRDAILWMNQIAEPDSGIFLAYEPGHRVRAQRSLYAPDLKITGVLTSQPDENIEMGAEELEAYLASESPKEVLFALWTEEGKAFTSVFEENCTLLSHEKFDFFEGYRFDCSP